MNPHPEVRAHLCLTMKSKRLANHQTQEDVAAGTNLDPGTVSRYERGELEPSPEVIYDYAQFFQCPISDFFPPLPKLVHSLIVLAVLGNQLIPELIAA